MTNNWANLSLPHKTGERNKGVKHPSTKVTEVEDAECPMWQGCHQLINTKTGTYCIRCGRPWAELDLELNGERS